MQDNTPAMTAAAVARPAVAVMAPADRSPSRCRRHHLVGPGCAAYAEQVPTGPGSVAELSGSRCRCGVEHPLLTTLTAAVSGELNPHVNLVDTLDGGQFTVFAPTDEAFAKLDPATVETLKTNSDLLTSILTYHVVPGQVAPGAGRRHPQDRSAART